MNTDLKAFETLWSIRGHAEVIVEVIKHDGVSQTQLKTLKETIDRMQELINECIEESAR